MSFVVMMLNVGLKGTAKSYEPTYSVLLGPPSDQVASLTDVCREFSVTRDRGDAFNGLRAATATFVLDNQEGRWSPAAGMPYGTILWGPDPWGGSGLDIAQTVRIEADYLGGHYFLFNGFIDSLGVAPKLGDRTVTVRASDRLRKIGRKNFTVGSVFADLNVTSAWAYVMDQVDHVGNIDTLYDVLPYYWKKDEVGATQAMNELMQIAPAYAYVNGQDVITVKDRYWPVRETVAGSYVNAALDLTYTLADDGIINRATIRSKPRRVSTTVQTLAWLEETQALAPGQTTGFTLSYRDPVTQESDLPAVDMQTPIPGVDFVAYTASGGNGSDHTGGLIVGVDFGAVSAACTLTNIDDTTLYTYTFNLRGRPLQRQAELDLTEEASQSIVAYDTRAYTLSNDLIGEVEFARDYARFLVYEHAEPRADISLSLKNEFPGILRHDIGSVLHVREDITAVGSLWIVTGVGHRVRMERGTEHTATYDLEFFRDPEWLILDDPEKGKLDFRRLAF